MAMKSCCCVLLSKVFLPNSHRTQHQLCFLLQKQTNLKDIVLLRCIFIYLWTFGEQHWDVQFIRVAAMAEGTTGQSSVIGALSLSVTSSVAIVICNKALIGTLDFPFATTLTSWHLVVTFCTLFVAKRLHLFESKHVDVRTVVFFGLLNGTSIGLLNLTLGFNSVGFYQMTKLAIIPFTVMLETFFLGKKFR